MCQLSKGGTTTMPKQTSAVVDRISEGKTAVILAEEIRKEFTVDIDQADIPLREGLWLNLTIDQTDNIIAMEANEALTKEKTAAIDNVMARLRKRKGSKFKS